MIIQFIFSLGAFCFSLTFLSSSAWAITEIVLRKDVCESSLVSVTGIDQPSLVQTSELARYLDPNRCIERTYTQIRPFSSGAVASFGSSSDVLRLMSDFPQASSYHLFDIFDYSSSPKAELLDSFFWQLLQISRRQNIEIVEKGFLDVAPASVWRSESSHDAVRSFFKRNLPNRIELRSPLVIRLKIHFRNDGKLYESVKTVVFHPIDFTDGNQIKQGLADMKRIGGPLQGVIMTGVTLPYDGPLLSLLGQELQPQQGVFVTEVSANSFEVIWSRYAGSFKEWKSFGRASNATRISFDHSTAIGEIRLATDSAVLQKALGFQSSRILYYSPVTPGKQGNIVVIEPH